MTAPKAAKVFWHLHDPLTQNGQSTSRRFLTRIQYGIVGKKANLISVADEYRKKVVALGFPEEQTCTVVNGINTSRIRFKNAETAEHKYDFMTFGWDFYRKGDDLILAACDKLAGEGYKFSLLLNGNAYILYSFYLLNTVCSYFLFAYRGSLLTAHQRTDVDNLVNTVIPLVNWVVQTAALFIFRSYYAYAIFLPVSTIVTNFVRLYFVKKLFPDLYAEGKVEPELEKSIYKKMKALVSAKISTTILHSSDSIVISAFLGLTMVAAYNNYHYIMTSVGGFLGIVYASILPGIGNSLVTETKEKNYKDFKKLTFINMWMTLWCAVCLLCLYQPFMKLWAGEDLLLPFAVMVLIVIYFVMYQGRKIVITYKDAAGIWWEDRFRPIIMAATNLVSNLIMVQFIGVFGIVLSTILSLCISLPWETYTVFKYVFKRSAKEYVLSLVKYVSVFAVAAAITYGACQIVQEGIIAIVVRAAICVVIPNMIFLLFFAQMDEFKASKEILTRILKKKN